MNRQIAIAYALVGLAVAVALITVIGATAGFAGGSDPPSGQTEVAASEPLPAPFDLAQAKPMSSLASATNPGVEIVYIDEPVPSGRGYDDDSHDDDDDDRWEYEDDDGDDDHREHERGGHREHDDD